MNKEQQNTRLEQHLQTVLSGNVHTITAPPEMDAGIEQLFDQYAAKRQKQTRSRKHTSAAKVRKPRGRYYQWQMAVLLVLGITVLSSGTYAANVAYSITTGEAIISYKIDDLEPITPEQSNDIRKIVSEVRSQLAPGQSAYVHSSKFNAMAYMGSTVIVNQPHKFSEIDSWYPAIQPITGPVATPSYVPEGYKFAYGLDEYYISGAHVNDKKKQVHLITNLLENKAVHPLRDYAWTPVPPEDDTDRSLQVPMLIYSSPSGKTIQLSYFSMIHSDSNNISFENSKDSSLSIVHSSKGKMFYSTTPNQSLEFSANPEPGLAQYLNWASQPDDQGKVHTTFNLTTDDPSLSKEELIKMAEGLK